MEEILGIGSPFQLAAARLPCAEPKSSPPNYWQHTRRRLRQLSGLDRAVIAAVSGCSEPPERKIRSMA
jgi:hypothetical protein